MIVRDEERMLPACLASAREAADEIVVVDTGSRDATRDVARRHGARVVEFAWCDDFAAARNEALRYATGDWILQLDADERLAPGAAAGVRRAVRDGVEHGALRLHNAVRVDASAADVVAGDERIGEPLLLPRLFRRHPGMRYQGVVHESLEEWWAERGVPAREVDADVVHLGATAEARSSGGKAERNLRLLRRRCALEPGSITPLAYLASELLELGRTGEAEEAVERAWAVWDGQPAWRSVHQLAVTRAFLAQARGDAARVLETVAAAEARQGPTPDLCLLRGAALEAQALRLEGSEAGRRLGEAEVAYRQALAPHPRGGKIAPLVAGAGSWAARVRLATVLLLLSRPAEAREEFARAAASAPDPLEARLGEAEALLDAGRADEAGRALRPLLGPRPDGWILAAAAARERGQVVESATLLAEAGRRLAVGFVAPHRAWRARSLAGGRAPDFAALLAALIERRAVAEEDRGAPVALDLLRRMSADLLARGRGDLLVPLLETADEAACPGLPDWMRQVLAELGSEAVEEGEGPAAPGAPGR
jgi:tetratricopeptide (TPR) repeat protein